MLLASPATILAMNNNNNTIQAADESTPLINKVKYEQHLEADVLDCCCLGFHNQKYQHIKEERELDFQLKMAEKKRQLAALLVGVNNTASTTPPTLNVMEQLPVALPNTHAIHEAPCANCSTGVDNFCKGVTTCLAWTIGLPCACCKELIDAVEPSPIEPSTDNRIAAMKKKQEFIEQAKSMGYYEDPARCREDDRPWIIYENRYIRIPSNASNNNQ